MGFKKHIKKQMKLQDWQKQILKMTGGQELAPLFKPKKKNVKKTKSKTKQKNKQDD